MSDIKRLNYFMQQFLVDTDFNDEQFYHREMRLRHNKTLHTWGVADGGLPVTASSSDNSVNVGAGMAVDNLGREIILLSKQKLDLSGFGANADVYITIQYQEQASDFAPVGGAQKNTRWTESPDLQAKIGVPPSDGSAIPLALVHIDGNGNFLQRNIDQSIRPIASSKIAPESNLQVGSLSVSGDASVGGRLGIGATDPVARLTVQGNESSANGIGAAIKLSNSAAGGRNWYLRIGATGTNTPAGGFSIADEQAYRLVIDQNGNTGIGTFAPTHLFHVVAPDAVGLFESTGPQAYLRLSTNEGFDKRVEIANRPGGRLSLWTGGAGDVLNITRAGNVGIGTTTPATSLHIPLTGLQIGFSTTDTDNFHIASDTFNGPRALRFWNKNYGAGVHLLSLTATGNLGIGITNPNAPLHVKGGNWDVTNTNGDLKIGDDNYCLRIGVSNGGAGAGDVRLRAIGGTKRMLLGAGAEDNLIVTENGAQILNDNTLDFGTNTRQMINLWATNYGLGVQSRTSYLRTDKNTAFFKGGSHSHNELDPGGGILQMVLQEDRVGIGTANPTHRIHVVAADAVGLFESSGSQAYLRLSTNEGLNNRVEIANRSGGRLSLWTGGAGDVLNITRGGSVGIGTTNPGTKLEVNSANASAIRVMSNAADSFTAYQLGRTSVDSSWGVAGATGQWTTDSVAGDVILRTEKPSQRLILNSGSGGSTLVVNNGKVGIGISNPSALGLHIGSGVVGGQAQIQLDNQNGQFGMINRWTNRLEILSSDKVGISFGTIGTERFAFYSNGDFTCTGSKGGYVVDLFVNRVGDMLEQGDVIVINSASQTYYSGTDNNIPIPEVDLTDKAYDRLVCGIVDRVVTDNELPFVEMPSEPINQAKKGKRGKNSEGGNYVHPLKQFAPEYHETLDRTKVDDRQMGKMVTLGAFANCKVDADIAPIHIGDLLTTSPTKGHAQKVLEPNQALGAILGKALGSLENGKGKIPILVMLQ